MIDVKKERTRQHWWCRVLFCLFLFIPINSALLTTTAFDWGRERHWWEIEIDTHSVFPVRSEEWSLASCRHCNNTHNALLLCSHSAVTCHSLFLFLFVFSIFQQRVKKGKKDQSRRKTKRQEWSRTVGAEERPIQWENGHLFDIKYYMLCNKEMHSQLLTVFWESLHTWLAMYLLIYF